jgi:hypothetical protein
MNLSLVRTQTTTRKVDSTSAVACVAMLCGVQCKRPVPTQPHPCTGSRATVGACVFFLFNYFSTFIPK